MGLHGQMEADAQGKTALAAKSKSPQLYALPARAFPVRSELVKIPKAVPFFKG
jgi:hypothetical protein